MFVSSNFPYKIDNYSTLLKVYNNSEAFLLEDFSLQDDFILINPDFTLREKFSQYGGYLHIDGEDMFYESADIVYKKPYAIKKIENKSYGYFNKVFFDSEVVEGGLICGGEVSNRISLGGFGYTALGQIEINGEIIDFTVKGNGLHGSGSYFNFSKNIFFNLNSCFFSCDGWMYISTYNFSFVLKEVFFSVPQTDSSGNALKRVCQFNKIHRGINGTEPSHHFKGSVARSFIVAEHYNLMTSFFDKKTIDDLSQTICGISDICEVPRDNECTNTIVEVKSVEEDPCAPDTGTYHASIEIGGNFNIAKIDFGDGFYSLQYGNKAFLTGGGGYNASSEFNFRAGSYFGGLKERIFGGNLIEFHKEKMANGSNVSRYVFDHFYNSPGGRSVNVSVYADDCTEDVVTENIEPPEDPDYDPDYPDNFPEDQSDTPDPSPPDFPPEVDPVPVDEMCPDIVCPEPPPLPDINVSPLIVVPDLIPPDVVPTCLSSCFEYPPPQIIEMPPIEINNKLENNFEIEMDKSIENEIKMAIANSVDNKNENNVDINVDAPDVAVDTNIEIGTEGMKIELEMPKTMPCLCVEWGVVPTIGVNIAVDPIRVSVDVPDISINVPEIPPIQMDVAPVKVDPLVVKYELDIASHINPGDQPCFALMPCSPC